MGKAATLLRARTHEARQRHSQRLQRSQTARLKRREEASGGRASTSARVLHPVTAARPSLSSSNAQLVLRQFGQACRLPAPVADLCAVLQRYTDTEKKEAAENNDHEAATAAIGGGADGALSLSSIAEAFVALSTVTMDRTDDADTDDDDEEEEEETNANANANATDRMSGTGGAAATHTLLHECLCDENGHRLAEALLRALGAAPDAASARWRAAVCAAVCTAVRKDPALMHHPHAFRVVVALVRADAAHSAAQMIALLPRRPGRAAASDTAAGGGVGASVTRRRASEPSARGGHADRDDANPPAPVHRSGEEEERVLDEPHMARIVEALLRAQPERTSGWMCDWLGLSPTGPLRRATTDEGAAMATPPDATMDDHNIHELAQTDTPADTETPLPLTRPQRDRKDRHEATSDAPRESTEPLPVAPPRPSTPPDDVVVRWVEDRVAGSVMDTLAEVCAAAAVVPLWEAVAPSAARLLTSKRGVSFLTHLLGNGKGGGGGGGGGGGDKATDEHAGQRAVVAAALYDAMAEHWRALACDGRANFVLQRVMVGCGASRRRRLVDALHRAPPPLPGRREPPTPAASGWWDVATHPVGVHVVVCLIATSAVLASRLLTRQTVSDWLTHPHGSLVLRAYLTPPRASSASSASSPPRQWLDAAVAQQAMTLAYDGWGNLVLQRYLAVAPASVVAGFARRVMDGGEAGRRRTREEEPSEGSSFSSSSSSSSSVLLAMAQHGFASHVVGTLLEVADAATHSRLCGALRPHLLRLATHLNGRFLVERLLAVDAGSRALLTRHVARLAMQKGTQHLLGALLRALDASRRDELLARELLPRLAELATHPCGSVTLQKLMQSDAAVCAAVRGAIGQSAALASTLAQSFHGRFVMQNAQL